MDSSAFLTYAIFLIVAFVIQIWVIRVGARADENIRNQQAMIWFLIKLCEKQGVEAEEIENIRNNFKVK